MFSGKKWDGSWSISGGGLSEERDALFTGRFNRKQTLDLTTENSCLVINYISDNENFCKQSTRLKRRKMPKTNIHHYLIKQMYIYIYTHTSINQKFWIRKILNVSKRSVLCSPRLHPFETPKKTHLFWNIMKYYYNLKQLLNFLFIKEKSVFIHNCFQHNW